MENSNEYNDDEFTRGSIDLNTALGRLWEAGASFADIEEQIRSGLENAGVDAAVVLGDG